MCRRPWLSLVLLILLPLAANAQSSPPPACQSGCPDADGDGLCDSWEAAGGIDLNSDGRIDSGHDLKLPGADTTKPDIYLQYDWMGYGDTQNACSADADCTALGLGHAGETCSGPGVPGSAKSCAFACTEDIDCTARAFGASHVGEKCIRNRCQHTHDPEAVAPGAIQAVVDKFAERGFNLHVVRGRAVPHSHVLSFRLLDDVSKPANTMADACEGGSVASGTAGMGKYAESLYDLKSKFFDAKRAPAYHYSIFSHYPSCDTTGHCLACPEALNPDGTPKNQPTFGMSGIAEIGGNDLIVGLGNRTNDQAFAPSVFDWGGTFMHELGHNLGLHHGGGSGLRGCGSPDCDAEDTPNFKPNYLSVMNNLYQFSGILRGNAIGSSTVAACATDADCLTGEHCTPTGACSRLDYSTQTLPTGGNTPGALDENANLNEPAGLGSGNAELFIFRNGACDAAQRAASEGPVDWDGDGVADNPNATADLNSFDHSCGTVFKVLQGHTDWGPAPGQSVFIYRFQCNSWGKD